MLEEIYSTGVKMLSKDADDAATGALGLSPEQKLEEMGKKMLEETQEGTILWDAFPSSVPDLSLDVEPLRKLYPELSGFLYSTEIYTTNEDGENSTHFIILRTSKQLDPEFFGNKKLDTFHLVLINQDNDVLTELPIEQSTLQSLYVAAVLSLDPISEFINAYLKE